jgi:uncharacterized membrane protein (UPF0136 family)
MNRQHGYAAYAALGALIGGIFAYASQLGSQVGIVACAVVGALFGLALRDAL